MGLAVGLEIEGDEPVGIVADHARPAVLELADGRLDVDEVVRAADDEEVPGPGRHGDLERAVRRRDGGLQDAVAPVPQLPNCPCYRGSWRPDGGRAPGRRRPGGPRAIHRPGRGRGPRARGRRPSPAARTARTKRPCFQARYGWPSGGKTVRENESPGNGLSE